MQSDAPHGMLDRCAKVSQSLPRCPYTGAITARSADALLPQQHLVKSHGRGRLAWRSRATIENGQLLAPMDRIFSTVQSIVACSTF